MSPKALSIVLLRVDMSRAPEDAFGSELGTCFPSPAPVARLSPPVRFYSYCFLRFPFLTVFSTDVIFSRSFLIKVRRLALLIGQWSLTFSRRTPASLQGGLGITLSLLVARDFARLSFRQSIQIAKRYRCAPLTSLVVGFAHCTYPSKLRLQSNATRPLGSDSL